MNPDRGEPIAWLDAPGWYKMHRIIWSIDGISPCVTTCAGGNVKPNIYIPQEDQRMTPDYIEIPTWPEYNNQNRVYLGGGICPTLTTQCSHSKPPLVLVEGAE